MTEYDYGWLVNGLRRKGIENERVLDAILTTPRHLFMSEDLRQYATKDTALPIDCEQTISQPYVVALMTEAILAQTPPPKNVLEIGTGSGYQAAILAKLFPEVYTVERIEPLHQQAKQRFEALGLTNIDSHFGDGYLGWPEHAPYDAIIVTAASSAIPEPLLQQLNMGGQMIIPVGSRFGQRLLLISKTAAGYQESELDPVIFVPLLHGTASNS